jgi:hypothetical protein
MLEINRHRPAGNVHANAVVWGYNGAGSLMAKQFRCATAPRLPLSKPLVLPSPALPYMKKELAITRRSRLTSETSAKKQWRKRRFAMWYVFLVAFRILRSHVMLQRGALEHGMMRSIVPEQANGGV